MYSDIIYAIENNQIMFLNDMHKNNENVYVNNNYQLKIIPETDHITLRITDNICIESYLDILIKDNNINAKFDNDNVCVQGIFIDIESIDIVIDFIVSNIKLYFMSPCYLVNIVNKINERVIILFKNYNIKWFSIEFFAQCDGFCRMEFDNEIEVRFRYDLHNKNFYISLNDFHDMLTGSLIELLLNKVDLSDVYSLIESRNIGN